MLCLILEIIRQLLLVWNIIFNSNFFLKNEIAFTGKTGLYQSFLQQMLDKSMTIAIIVSGRYDIF